MITNNLEIFNSIDEPKEPDSTSKFKLASVIKKRMSKIKVLAKFTRTTKIDIKKQEDLIIVIKILRKSRKYRTIRDLDILENAFMPFAFFHQFQEQYGTNYNRNLLKELTYAKYSYLQEIYRAADPPNKFFLILKGSVLMLRPNNFLLQNQPAFLTNQEKDQFFFADEDYIRSQYPSYALGQTKSLFDSLEPEALQSNEPYQYTTICRGEQVHLAVLNFEAYRHQIGDFQRTIIQRNVDFLQQIHFFSDMRMENLGDIVKNSDQKNYIMNQILYREGDLADEIFVIKEGMVEISQLVQQEKRKLTFNEKFLQQYYVYPLNIQYKRVKLACLSANQIFGQEELLMNCNRQTLAQCKSEKTVLLIIKKSAIFSYFTRGDYINRLEDYSLQKEQWRANIERPLSQIEIPKSKIIEKQISKSRQVTPEKRDLILQEISMTLPKIQSVSPKQSPENNLPKEDEEQKKLEILEHFRNRYIKKINVSKITSFQMPKLEINQMNKVTHNSSHAKKMEIKNFEDKSDSFRKNGIVIVDIDLKNNKLMKQRLRELKGKNNYRFFSVPRHREQSSPLKEQIIKQVKGFSFINQEYQRD